MANEEIVFSVKSNIKSVTKDTEDYAKSLTKAEKAQKELNEQISIQNTVLNDMEKELVELKAKQDAIPKGAWYAGMDDLNKKIKDTEKNIKLEKIGLKDLENQQKDNNKELKNNAKDLKETNKESKESIGNFRIMGVSLNGVKAAMGKVIPMAKTMFGTIRAGLISTGVGAILVAFGALAAYFTSTKKGADQLKVAFAAIGATIDVLKDRLSDVGEAISLVFQGKWSEAGDKLKESVKGIVAEIKAEIKAMSDLEKRLQSLRDAEMAFMIQKAKTRQEIEKARLVAEDETKTAKERLENLKKALELEEKTTNRELELAREKVAIQQEQMAVSKNLVEDEQKLAELKVALIEKETASIKMRRRVVTEVNALEREIRAAEKARAKEKLDEIEAEKKATEDLYNAQIKQAEAWEKSVISQLDALTAARFNYTSAVGKSIGTLGNLMKEGSAAAKTFALAEIAINTAVGFMQGLTIAQKAASATGPAAALAFPIFYASQIAAVLGAVSSAKGVLGGSGGDVQTPTPNLVGSTPAPSMLSGKFELGNIQEQQPVQAYVVTDNLTDNQNKLAYIRRRATI